VRGHRGLLLTNQEGVTVVKDLGPVPREGLDRHLDKSFEMGQGAPNVGVEDSDEEERQDVEDSDEEERQEFAQPVVRGPSADHRLARLRMRGNDCVHVFAGFAAQLLKRSRTFAAMQEFLGILTKAPAATSANIPSVWHPRIAAVMPAMSTDLKHFMRQLLMLPETRADPHPPL